MEQIPVLYQRSDILAKAGALREQAAAWRRDFHRHPELSFEEVRTSEIVARHLQQLGLEVRRGVGRTGVVGVLRVEQPGPVIGLRADMDALPIQDQKEAAYRSTVPGKMHACGHDAHTSMLMGAAQFLSQVERPPRGTVVFVFQPAEEDGGGANVMIEDGLLRDYGIEAMAGLHVFPGVSVGEVTAVRGVGCAAADTIRITIIGRGGHAAHPHLAVDSVAVAAEVISALQQIASRQVDPLDPIVITIGKIQGGTASNVIAPQVELLGTVRTLNPALREQMPARIEQVVSGVTSAMGAAYAFDYEFGYPSIINDDRMVDLVLETAEQVLGPGRCRLVKPSMGGEDFSYYTHHVPGVFFRLGVGNPEKLTPYPLHHPLFDIDEDALPVGIAMLSALALNYLGR
ncbi:M20 family metallopeptidase [Brevibacillus sp. WF146]|uniref:M20 metallopeptidase family protein n=1 Tax=Brevibacillus sp. WF146 TaxID=319501 RepID=UPI0007ED817C|nr:M20 family metallopeptidase [Brevibacillus sp. WF146]UYZ14389.1 M20 family metallopeptidase [Brevibacillus sp. WF146]